MVEQAREHLLAITELVETRQIRVVIDKEYSLREVPTRCDMATKGTPREKL